jgi:GntR family transcriptional regulator
VRPIRYHQIAEQLRRRILAGELSSGQVLPSEAALGAEHDASRVTIRKALELLRSEGLVESRQGFGWSVAALALRQPLVGLVTIEEQLAAQGKVSERRVLEFRFIDAPPVAAANLGQRVLEVRRLNLADDTPFARVTVWCREDLGASLSKAAVERSSFYELLAERPASATQTIGAEAMAADDAELLEVPPGGPALVVRRVTVSAGGRPLLVAEHVFPGHLTEFVADLPRLGGDEASSPAGLRLVAD